MLSEAQEKAYREFTSAAWDGAVFDRKTSQLLKLAAAMAIGCYP